MEVSSPCHGVRLDSKINPNTLLLYNQQSRNVWITCQKTQRTSPALVVLLAHCSKHVSCILLPQAALHHTIFSVSGSNSVKQIGQSPEISLRLEGLEEEAISGSTADSIGGARAKMVFSS